eukprot:scaffold52374_cov14-Tisochrysis_lutea.AAC.1
MSQASSGCSTAGIFFHADLIANRAVKESMKVTLALWPTVLQAISCLVWQGKACVQVVLKMEDVSLWDCALCSIIVPLKACEYHNYRQSNLTLGLAVYSLRLRAL